MPSARTVQINRNYQKSSTYCETGDSALIPPVIRLLLNSIAPKQIMEVQSDRDATAWETAALGLLKDEDGTKILFKKTPDVNSDGAFRLFLKQGHALMGRGGLLAEKLTIAGPNVDISRRDQLTAEVKATHTGVHNVHRLYLSAAFLLLRGAG